MKVVDTFNLPADLVRAISNDPYDRGDAEYSGTDLTKPAQALILERRHDHELEIEALDRLWACAGQALHLLIERAGVDETDICREKRLFAEVDAGKWGKVKISTQLDAYVQEKGVRTVRDFKWTSAKTLIYGGRSEWSEQINIQAWFLRENGYPEPEHGEIVAVFRDWDQGDLDDHRKKMARYGKISTYPRHEVGRIPIKLLAHAAVEAAIKAKLMLLKAMEQTPDEKLVPCTDPERWANKWGPARCTGGKRGRPYCPVAKKFCHQLKREGRRV